MTPPSVSPDEANVMRQALAGMLWGKQYFYFDVDKWLDEHSVDPWSFQPKEIRNREWSHMINDHVISMPDKWAYPWYAAWDLAFHTVALSVVDPDFARQQLDLMLREVYLHPSGQVPDYEWNFGDVNPPGHAWATIFFHRTEEALRGEGDIAFLKKWAFGKLMMNFNWWVNRRPYGIRSLSKFHQDHPYIFHVNGQEYWVDYLPAESDSGMFGGNSNWRGPIWFPVNALLYRVLLQYYLYYGDSFKVECPTGSGQMMNLYEVADELGQRLTRIFLPDKANPGRRPVFGGTEKFQSDPHWRDHLLFYEYFHGDNGAGLGASHQTGWTGLVAKLIQLHGFLNPQRALEVGKQASFEQKQDQPRKRRK